MLNESTELEVAILDTLGNLCLEASDLAELRGDVVRTLPSAQLSDVPVIVKFLLQTASSTDDALEVCVNVSAASDFLICALDVNLHKFGNVYCDTHR